MENVWNNNYVLKNPLSIKESTRAHDNYSEQNTTQPGQNHRTECLDWTKQLSLVTLLLQ